MPNVARASQRALAQNHVAQPPSAVIRLPEAAKIGPGAGRSTPEAGVPHLTCAVVPGLLIALVLACPLAAAAATTTAPEKGTTLLLFDGQHTLKSMPHVKIVDDPFATTQPAAGRAATQPEDLKVLKGGPLGPEEAYQNKGTFPADHFVMPAGGQVELVVVVAMKRLTDLKVEVWARDPKGGMKFRTTLPPEANTAWQAVIVPIDATRIQPGSTIDDITIFQVGKDDAARLFIRSVSVRVK